MKHEAGIAFPTKRLKYLVSLRRSSNTGRDGARPYIGLEDIEPRTGRLVDDDAVSAVGTTPSADDESKSPGNGFESGDVLFGKLRPYLAKAWVAEFPGRCTTEALVMAPHSIEPRFLRDVCLSSTFIHAVNASTFGSKMPRAEWNFIANIPIPAPDREKQVVIADYLERETERLDALVVAKERFLKLLAEKRKALITRAVTRGLDPHVPLCNFGVPANFSSSQRRLKYLASINDDVLGEETADDFDMQYIDIGNVDSSGRISELESYRFEDAPSRARRRVRDGDVIISTVRTYLQAITHIHEPPANLVVSTGFAVVRPHRDLFDSHYCRFALREPAFLAEVEKRSVGVNYPAINVTDLADIPVFVHTLSQQRAIADYLDRETARLDAIMARVRQAIAFVEERRTALITAAVAGRIDARSTP